MAQYFLSANPTINNFGLDTNTIDRFFVDTGSASTLNIFQSGNNVVVTNGTNTATFTNQLLSQFAIYANNGNNNVVGVSTVTVTDNTNILIGTDAADTRTGTTVAGGDYINGLGAGDTLNSNGGGDLIFGAGGGDTITLNADPAANSSNLGRAATVFGGQGNDVINGDSSSRSMLLFGNLGDDIISIGGNGLDYNNSTIYGGQGNDQINAIGSNASHMLYGDIGNDVLIGGNGNDTLFGGNDADTLNGGAGNDLLFGNQGTDVITASAGNDTVFGGQDADTINYGGAAGVQLLLGNLGSDTITGGNANDTIYGGQGNDYIIGGTGADRIFGDLGSDVIGYTGTFDAAGIGAQSGLTTATADQINGFVTGVDRISFSNGAAVSPASYTEFSNSQVTTVEQAVTAATASQAQVGIRNYVFVAGGSNGYLVEYNNAGTAIAAQTLVGLNSTSAFESTDIIATAPGAIA